MNRFSHRAIVSALAGAIALTSFGLTPASAAPAKPRDDGKSLVNVDNVDVSSQRRRYRGRNNDAAAAAAFLGVAGAIAGGVAASRYRRDRYYDGYGYGRGYRAYGPGYGHYDRGYYGRPRYYY